MSMANRLDTSGRNEHQATSTASQLPQDVQHVGSWLRRRRIRSHDAHSSLDDANDNDAAPLVFRKESLDSATSSSSPSRLVLLKQAASSAAELLGAKVAPLQVTLDGRLECLKKGLDKPLSILNEKLEARAKANFEYQVKELGRFRNTLGLLEDQFPPMTLRYCLDCKSARASPQYQSRVDALLLPLICSGCGTTHAAIWFSPAQRGNLDHTSRICRRYDIPYEVCPHRRFERWNLENLFKFARVGRWGRRQRLSCEEPGCLFRTSIIVNNKGMTPSIISYVSLGAFPTLEEFWKSWRETAQKLHQLEPMGGFCPQIGVQPALFDAIATNYAAKHIDKLPLRDDTSDSEDENCEDSFYLRHTLHYVTRAMAEGKTPRPKFHGSLVYRRSMDFFKTSFSTPYDLNHVGQPSSNDAETKYITWCDDPNCCTSFAGLRAEALKMMGCLKSDGILTKIARHRVRDLINRHIGEHDKGLDRVTEMLVSEVLKPLNTMN